MTFQNLKNHSLTDETILVYFVFHYFTGEMAFSIKRFFAMLLMKPGYGILSPNKDIYTRANDRSVGTIHFVGRDFNPWIHKIILI